MTCEQSREQSQNQNFSRSHDPGEAIASSFSSKKRFSAEFSGSCGLDDAGHGERWKMTRSKKALILRVAKFLKYGYRWLYRLLGYSWTLNIDAIYIYIDIGELYEAGYAIHGTKTCRSLPDLPGTIMQAPHMADLVWASQIGCKSLDRPKLGIPILWWWILSIHILKFWSHRAWILTLTCWYWNYMKFGLT